MGWFLSIIMLCLAIQAFHCAEPSSRQVFCAPLFASLLAYEVYYELTEEEGAVPAEHQVRWGGAKPVTVWGPGILVFELLRFLAFLERRQQYSRDELIHLV